MIARAQKFLGSVLRLRLFLGKLLVAESQIIKEEYRHTCVFGFILINKLN